MHISSGPALPLVMFFVSTGNLHFIPCHTFTGRPPQSPELAGLCCLPVRNLPSRCSQSHEFQRWLFWITFFVGFLIASLGAGPGSSSLTVPALVGTPASLSLNKLSACRWQSTGATQRGQLWPWPGAAAAPPWPWGGRGCWNPTTALTEHEAQSYLLCSYQTCLTPIQEEGPKVSVTIQSRARAWWENSAVLLQGGCVDAAQEIGNIPFTGAWKTSPGSVDVEWRGVKSPLGDPEGCLLRG